MPVKEESRGSNNDIIFEFKIKLPDGLIHLTEKYIGTGLKAISEIARFGRSLVESSDGERKELKKIEIK